MGFLEEDGGRRFHGLTGGEGGACIHPSTHSFTQQTFATAFSVPQRACGLACKTTLCDQAKVTEALGVVHTEEITRRW